MSRGLGFHGPLLPNYELVGSPEEDLGGEVPPQFAAQGAINGDGLERELLPPGRHVAAAAFASDHEGFAA